jgi:DNA oxidative demethylase
MGRSRLGAVATGVPLAGSRAARQLSLSISSPLEAASERSELLSGVVWIRRWLDLDEQRALVAEFRRWALPPAGLRHPRVPSGHLMSVQSVCLGWHWYPYVYSRTADDTDGAPVKPLPMKLIDLSRRAVAEAYGRNDAEARRYRPDAAIVNLYAPDAQLGLHRDAEEPSDAPVVTLSLGDTCIFRLSSVERRTGPSADLEMRSGDLLVFGRENRRIYHGVPKILPDTAPDGLDLPPGRLSITVRETGLEG